MPSFAPVLPHGSITEVLPDIFQVTGSIRFAPLLTITRNMTVVRQGKELTVLNSVRLDPEGEAELDKLGDVTHVVRVGAFHGLDDPYYVDRYKATLWGPPGLQHGAGLTARDLTTASCPLEGAQVFLFEHAMQPESAIILERDGGVIIPCDSFQNWTSFKGCSILGGLMMRALDFRPAVIGRPWLQRAGGPHVHADFQKLLEVPFSHLLPAHGAVLRDDAKEGLRAAMAHRFA